MQNRPKIGIALSGASGRAIAHIGILEVLREHDIPIDYIVGCSSSALIAVSFAAGTMEYLKQWFYRLTVRKLISLWSMKNVKGGLFHLDKTEPELNRITKRLKFEDLRPQVAFVAADINTGEMVTLNKGSINKAFKATVAVPGLFVPVIHEGRVLVDGGLVNIVPTKVAKELGADIVIGVNLAGDKFIYENKLPIWRGYRFITRLLGLQFIREKIITKLSSRILFQFDSQSDVLEENDIRVPGVLSVLTKALDHGLKFSQQWTESDIACDLMLEPRVKHYGKVETKQLEKIYQEGRRAAEAAIPEIKKMIENFEKAQSELLNEYQTS